MDGDQAPRGERPGAGQPVTHGEHGHGEAKPGAHAPQTGSWRGQSVRCTPTVLCRGEAPVRSVSSAVQRAKGFALQPPDLDQGRRGSSTPPYRSALPAREFTPRGGSSSLVGDHRESSARSFQSCPGSGITPPGFCGRKPRLKAEHRAHCGGGGAIRKRPTRPIRRLSGKVFTILHPDQGQAHSHQNPRVSARSSHFRRSSRPRSLRFSRCS